MASRLVFDIEANSLHPDIVWCVIAKDIDTGKLYKFYGNNIELFIPVLSNATELIGHNIIDYDLPVLKDLFQFVPRQRTSITDTLVISRVLFPDREGGHSLEAWGERLGFSKGSSPGFGSFSPALLDYCRRDVELTERVYRHLDAELVGDCVDWTEAIKLEHQIAQVIHDQEAKGFYFNVEEAESLVKNVESRISRIDSHLVRRAPVRIRKVSTIEKPFKINGEVNARVNKHCTRLGIDASSISGPVCLFELEHLNPDSPQQLKEFLLTQGWVPDQYTPTGAPKLTESSLEQLGPLGTSLIKRGSYSHRLSQIRGLLQRVRTDDKRIPAGANPCGTNTGRMRHFGIVNIPRASDQVVLGRELRSLFTVPAGNLLVGYDAKQLELRILAHYINDPAYTEIILYGDPHEFAQRAGGLPDRNAGKTLNYATVYGAGDKRLGTLVGGGVREGAAIRKRLYEAIPGLEALVKRVNAASAKGYVKGLDGRKLWLRQQHKALNTLIQGGGAIAMKWIAVRLDELAKSSGLKGGKVIDQHDEGQWEVESRQDAELLEKLVHQSFEECTKHFNLKCPLASDVTVGKTWAETH